MARRPSWLPRLPEIIKAVQASSRSHFDRARLEIILGVGSRAAQELLELIADQAIGRSHLVTRESLLLFLHDVQHHPRSPLAELATVVETNRRKKTKRLPRTLVTVDDSPPDAISLPDNVVLSRGFLQIRYDTVVQLVQNLYLLSRLIETDDFPKLYEPIIENTEAEQDRDDMARMFAELEQLQKEHKQRQQRGEVSP